MKRATPTTCPSGEHVIEFPLNIKREIILNEDGIGTDAFFPLEYLEKLSNFANIAKCYKLCKINNIHLCIDIASLEGIIIERRFPLIKTGWINRPGIDMTDEINKWDQLNKDHFEKQIDSLYSKKNSVFYPGADFHISDDLKPVTLNERQFFMPTRVQKMPSVDYITSENVNIKQEINQHEIIKNLDNFTYFNPIYFTFVRAETIPTYPQQKKVTLNYQAYVLISFDRFISTKMPELNALEITHTINTDPSLPYNPNDIIDRFIIEKDGDSIIINIKIEDTRLGKPLLPKKVITITANGIYNYT